MDNGIVDKFLVGVTDGPSNTRPLVTHQTGLRVLVDWVSMTFDLASDWQGVFDLIGLGKLPFIIEDWGFNSFTEHARFSHLVIQRKADTHYQLHFTGQGCREYEDYSTLDWLQLFAILKDFCNAKATRVDIAIDDFDMYYTVNMIRRAFLDGRCRTRMQVARINQDYNTSTLDLVMDSFYLGSINSRLSINFYDKKLEREAKGLDVTADTWTRTELRCKREYADIIIDLLLVHDDFGAVVMGVLKKHVSFIKKSKLKNISRVALIRWWDDFLRGVEPLALSVQAPDKTIERVKKWIGHSVAPSLALLNKADPAMFDDFLRESLLQGLDRLTVKHDHIINQYQDDKYKLAMQDIANLSSDLDITSTQSRLSSYLNTQKNAHLKKDETDINLH